MTYEQALAIVRERLGRDPSAQEQQFLRLLVSTGVTEEQLRGDNINTANDGNPLYPNTAVSASQEQVDAVRFGVPAEVAPQRAAQAQWDPNGQTLSAAPTDDPYSWEPSDETFYLQDPPVRVVEGTPVGQRTEKTAERAVAARNNAVKLSDFYNTLRFDWSPDQIRNLQEQLRAAGYQVDVTGQFDFALRDAVERAVQDSTAAAKGLLPWLSDRAVAVKQATRAAAKDAIRTASQDEMRRDITAVLYSLWGTPPSAAKVMAYEKSGMNIWEIEATERAKPAFERSPKFQEEALDLTFNAASQFGYLG